MADPRGFMKYPREVATRRPVAERVQDWQEVYPESPGRAVLPIITKQAAGSAKIDPLMAVFNAVTLMSLNPVVKGPSIYETRGMRFL